VSQEGGGNCRQKRIGYIKWKEGRNVKKGKEEKEDGGVYKNWVEK
jgi:hypothetical protein